MATELFRPFRGKNYESGFGGLGTKLLVLGESHYVGKDDYARKFLDQGMARFTTRVVKDFWTTKEGAPYLKKDFFGRLHRLLTGLDNTTLKQIQEAWNTVAFANYIPIFAGDGIDSDEGEGHSAAKRAKHWRAAREEFPGMLKELKPDRVLVIGKVNWNNIELGSDVKAKLKISDGISRDLWRLPTDQGNSALSTWVYHTSRGLDSIPTMRSILQKLMNTDKSVE